MRILLTSNASHDPPRGGSTRSNLVWLEHLASGGHQCLVVCSTEDDDSVSGRRGVSIESVKDLVRRRAVLRERIRSFGPDYVLVSSEDLSHLLLREAYAAAPDRLVYLAHTPQFYPFGPASWNPGRCADANVRLEQVEAWREQTSSRFVRREFDGGHFFIKTSRDVFLRQFEEDLRELAPH